MTKKREQRAVEQSMLVLFNTEQDLTSGARLLKTRAKAEVVRPGPAMEWTDPRNIIRAGSVARLRAWLSSSRRPPMPGSFSLALTADFDLHHPRRSASASKPCAAT